jgi:hypothetical protein
MTPAMVKHIYEASRRADAANKKREELEELEEPKTAEEILIPFFTKLALAGPKLPSVPTPRLMSAGAARKVMEFKPTPGMPGTTPVSSMGAPKAPGLRSVKPADPVVNPNVRPQNAIRNKTPAAKPAGLSGPGPMSVGS